MKSITIQVETFFQAPLSCSVNSAFSVLPLISIIEYEK